MSPPPRATRRQRSSGTQRTLWPYLSLIPLGLGAWAPIYAGVRARRTLWILLGVLWSAIVVAGVIHGSVSKSGQHGDDDLAGMLLILGWVGAIASSFIIRPLYNREMGSPLREASEAGRGRLATRQRARQLAASNPALALEMGVGRPDKAGATDAGLIDVNHASISALMKLPGVTEEIATQIIHARRELGAFSSLEDMGTTLDLDGHLVEGMREQAIFLPGRDA